MPKNNQTNNAGFSLQNWEQQDLYRAVVENSPVSITLVDRGGKFLYVNHSAEVALGLPAEQLLGHTMVEIFGQDGQDTLKIIRKIFRDKKSIHSELTYPVRGMVQYFEVTRQPIFDPDGQVSCVMSLMNNITERKQMDRLVRFQHSIDSLQSISDTFEHSLEALFDNLFSLDWVDAGGLYVINEEEQKINLIYHRGLSDEFVRLTGSIPLDNPGVQTMYSKKARFISIKDYDHPFRQAAISESLTFICAMPLVFQDMPVGQLNLASRTVHELGEFDRMAMESIARRVANLVQLLQTQDRLKRANEEMAGILQSLKENRQMLIQKSRLESLGELSAGLAHEINQPLSVISLAIENLELKLNHGSAGKEYMELKLRSISSNVNKIRQLIDHVRIFSRDQKETIMERIDVNDTIREALLLFKEQFRNHRITVAMYLDHKLGFALGNKSRLEQVFMNLLSNARDALDEKERKMQLPGMAKEIRITTVPARDGIEIEFHDTGTGMAKEDLERMFDPFFTTKPPGQGTGLGLPIVYGIIRDMKGSIKAKSTPGKFTRVIIRLPAVSTRNINA